MNYTGDNTMLLVFGLALNHLSGKIVICATFEKNI